jgi:hypothetical protein
LYALEGKLVVSQQNDSVTQSLFNKVHKRLVISFCIPFPLPSLESNELTCLWVEHYPFYGLCFKPLFLIKHVYHNWCAFVHFNESTKCIDVLRGEEMHKG